MVAEFGFGTLVITFLVTLYGSAVAAYGAWKNSDKWVESARNAMLLTFPLVTLVAGAIVYLLVSGDYQVEYVALVTSDSMPNYLKVTALWGGQEGSLVFWAWLMAAFASAVMLRKWDRDREMLPWVIIVSMVTLGFFISLILFFENPFVRLWHTGLRQPVVAMFRPEGAVPYVPRDGNGLNPLLRHPGMIIHPPMLYLGFVSFVIPFAFAIAALVTGRTDDRWIRVTRRWTLVAWLFLSLGLILGGRWAYDVLGWGGYWAWDPVEIAAFMPWLTGTAFLHSVMIQEKRGMLKHWNMVLIILTYSLVIFGTFLTRSGVLSSVHAFAQSAIGPMFFVFIFMTFTVSLTLLLMRWNSLKSEATFTSWLSRESVFLVQNFLWMGILIVCFWGVLSPLVLELLTGQKATVGPDWYEMWAGPLFAALLLLMGIAPLAAWRHSTAKTLGRAIWMPTLLSVVLAVVLFALGVRNVWALIGFGLAALVTLVTLYEFWRGANARSRTHGESLPVALWQLAGRNRRRYGGYTIHLGVVLMALGIIGIEMFQSETQATLAQGQSIDLGRYTVQYNGLSVWDSNDGRNIARAEVSVYEDGKFVGYLHPRRDYYYESQQPMTIPGTTASTMRVHPFVWTKHAAEGDLYVLLADWQPISTQNATFKVFYNPLVNWLWLGGIVFILGTLIAAWPERELEAAALKTRSPYAAAKA